MFFIDKILVFLNWVRTAFPSRNDFGKCGTKVLIDYPLTIEKPNNVFIGNYVYLRDGVRILNADYEEVTIKDYCVISSNVTISPNSHVSTVGVPQTILGSSHVNDKSGNLTIEEDCWIGTGATLLYGANLGRGCIVGAGAVVTKPVPPYAVVAGCPAKIISVKFSSEQILEHERSLYPKDKRLTSVQIQSLFSDYFEGLKIYGKSSDMTSKDKMKLKLTMDKWGYEPNK